MEGFWFLSWMQQEVIKEILQSRETQCCLCVLESMLVYPGPRRLPGALGTHFLVDPLLHVTDILYFL